MTHIGKRPPDSLVVTLVCLEPQYDTPSRQSLARGTGGGLRVASTNAALGSPGPLERHPASQTKRGEGVPSGRGRHASKSRRIPLRVLSVLPPGKRRSLHGLGPAFLGSSSCVPSLADHTLTTWGGRPHGYTPGRRTSWGLTRRHDGGDEATGGAFEGRTMST